MEWVDRSDTPYPYLSTGTWFTRYYYLLKHVQSNDLCPTVHDLRVARILLHASTRSKIGETPPGRVALAELVRICNGTYPYNQGKLSSSETGLG